MTPTNTPPEMLAFLRCVLPPETGDFYCALVLDGDKRRQFFFQTIEELAACILFHDRLGRTVYHACSSFKDPKGPTAYVERRAETSGSTAGFEKQIWRPRGQQNAAQARSLWLDIDAGPGKPYGDAHSGARALGEMCRAAGLPEPVLVGTGGGLHAYWPLDAALAPDAWKALAEGLKALCVKHGLHADPARTADLSSVLRTPYTHNYKYGPDAYVKLATLTKRYDRRDLQGIAALGERTAHHAAHIPSGRIKAVRLIDRVDATDRADFGASYCDRIADQCTQIAKFRESGNITEPSWFASIGVTAFATDGKVKTHEWSARNYPRYDPVEVDNRMARVLELSGPTTCGKFQSLDPGPCANCQHRGRITSPIQLGHAVPSVAPSLPTVANGEVPDGPEKLPALVEPFSWSPQGQMIYATEDNSGVPISTVVVNEPAFLVEVQRSEVGQPKYSYLLRHFLPRDGWTHISIDADQMFASNAISVLAKKGIVVHDAKLWFKYMRDTVSDFHQHQQTGTRYEQFGWKAGDTQFLVRHLYTPGGKITVQGGGEVANRAPYFGPQRPTANLIAWTEAADGLFGKASLALGIQILASFGAPLMRFALSVDGGCVVHLYSQVSGAGKSWALDAGWSVWGAKRAMMLVNDDTKVSKPIVMATLCNLPICYDEIRDKDPEVIRALIKLFSDGRDRLRGTADGGIRPVETTWRTMLLTNGNFDLIEKLDTLGVDADGFRVLQLLVPPLDMDKEAGAILKRRLEENAGVAGDKFMQYLIHPDVLPAVKTMIDQFQNDVWRQTGLSNAHRYRVAAATCILVAAVITKHLDILHFDIDRIRDLLIKELRDPSNAGSTTGKNPEEAAQAKLSDFLNASQGEILKVNDKWRPGRGATPVVILGDPPRGKISARYEEATKRLYIAETAFRAWCSTHQISFRDVVKELMKCGVVVDPSRKVTLTAGTRLVGAQGSAIEINCEHPALSGMVTSIDRLVTGGPNAQTNSVS